MQTLDRLADILHFGNHSLVVEDARGTVHVFDRRGVADLYALLHSQPELLKGANVADKVIGKGAAALMCLGGVERVYTDVLSRPALELFAASRVEDVVYDHLVPGIINRAGTGLCPVETLCMPCATPSECLPLIRGFLTRLKSAHPAEPAIK